MLNTVKDIRNHYTQRQYDHAKISIKIYQTVVHPPIKDYDKELPVMIEDIDMCDKISGPDIYMLKGKTVCTKPKSVIRLYLKSTGIKGYTSKHLSLLQYHVYPKIDVFCYYIQDN